MLDFPELDVPFRKMISPLDGCEVPAEPVLPWDPVSAGAVIIFPASCAVMSDHDACSDIGQEERSTMGRRVVVDQAQALLLAAARDMQARRRRCTGSLTEGVSAQPRWTSQVLKPPGFQN